MAILGEEEKLGRRVVRSFQQGHKPNWSRQFPATMSAKKHCGTFLPRTMVRDRFGTRFALSKKPLANVFHKVELCSNVSLRRGSD
jgi:hypothetical protein